MKTHSTMAVSRTPASSESVHRFLSGVGAGRFLGVALACGFLVGGGLVPGVAAAGEKVTLCHVPPGNPTNVQTLSVAPSAVQAHLKNHPGDYVGACIPAVSGCPCADNGDLIWSPAGNASAMVAYWVSLGLSSPWSCLADSTALQGTFIGNITGEFGPTPMTVSPAVTSGSCIGSNGAIPVNSTQAQACLQRINELAALLSPPVTCSTGGGIF